MKKVKMIALIMLCASLAYVVSMFLPAFFVKAGLHNAQREGKIIVGHRGAAGLAPENTLAAIERGIEAGADMVEIDIHLTSDGYLIVCHDQTVDRTTDGEGRICDMTLAQIKRLHVLNAWGQAIDVSLPTLDEVLTLVSGRCRVLIEIKRTGSLYQGIEQKLVNVIAAHNAQDWVVVQSFNDSVLFNLHHIAPELLLEKLVVGKLPGLPLIIDGISIVKFDYDKYDFVQSFNFYNHALNAALIDEIHAHGKQVKTWTHEGPEDQPCWQQVDGYITNRPDLWSVAH